MPTEQLPKMFRLQIADGCADDLRLGKIAAMCCDVVSVMVDREHHVEARLLETE
jgi:hypothetical protein